MNKTLIGILSTLVLLNTACSPQQDATPNSSTQSSTASNQVMTDTSPDIAVTPAETPSPPNGELLNTYWKLILINDTEVTVAENQREPHIIFNAESRVSGSDGCNRIMGSYLLDGDKLTLDEMAGTKMACAEGAEQTGIQRCADESSSLYSAQRSIGTARRNRVGSRSLQSCCTAVSIYRQIFCKKSPPDY